MAFMAYGINIYIFVDRKIKKAKMMKEFLSYMSINVFTVHNNILALHLICSLKYQCLLYKLNIWIGITLRSNYEKINKNI